MTQRKISRGGIIFLITCIALLCTLGTWQVKRLHWKNEVLQTLEKEYARDPLKNRFGAAHFRRIATQSPAIAYGMIRGHFRHNFEMLIGPRTHDGAPGYNVITPFAMAGDGGHVLVNRGWIPLDKADPSTRTESQTGGVVTLTGLARLPDKPNFFTPANDPAKHIWYSINPPEMATAANVPNFPDTIFYAETQDPWLTNTYPVMAATRAMPPNNHLQYAIFWFTMALVFAALPLLYALLPAKRGI